MNLDLKKEGVEKERQNASSQRIESVVKGKTINYAFAAKLYCPDATTAARATLAAPTVYRATL